MVQTVVSFALSSGSQKIVFEKPHTLRRIFYRITEMSTDDGWRQSIISFDDPSFSSYYVLDGQFKHFAMKGEGISQGDIWLRNSSEIDLNYTATEILVYQFEYFVSENKYISGGSCYVLPPIFIK